MHFNSLKVIANTPAHKNPLLIQNFIESPDPDGGKSIRYACIHCKKSYEDQFQLEELLLSIDEEDDNTELDKDKEVS
jgi:hypothetical protein